MSLKQSAELTKVQREVLERLSVGGWVIYTDVSRTFLRRPKGTPVPAKWPEYEFGGRVRRPTLDVLYRRGLLVRNPVRYIPEYSLSDAGRAAIGIISEAHRDAVRSLKKVRDVATPAPDGYIAPQNGPEPTSEEVRRG